MSWYEIFVILSSDLFLAYAFTAFTLFTHYFQVFSSLRNLQKIFLGWHYCYRVRGQSSAVIASRKSSTCFNDSELCKVSSGWMVDSINSLSISVERKYKDKFKSKHTWFPKTCWKPITRKLQSNLVKTNSLEPWKNGHLIRFSL